MTNYSELTIRIDNLETLILSIQDSVQYNITLFISILGLAIAIAGIAFYQLIKNDVISKYEKNISEQEERIANRIYN